MQAQSATIESAPENIVWVVGQMSDVTNEFDPGWSLQGVFTDRNRAISACHDENYFVGPVPLDTELPAEKVMWPGSFYPIQR